MNNFTDPVGSIDQEDVDTLTTHDLLYFIKLIVFSLSIGGQREKQISQNIQDVFREEFGKDIKEI